MTDCELLNPTSVFGGVRDADISGYFAILAALYLNIRIKPCSVLLLHTKTLTV